MEEFKNCCKGGYFNSLVGVATLLLLTLVVSTVIGIGDKLAKTENMITVSGVGEIYAKPDLAITYFSVTKEAKTVAEALSSNTKSMNAVIQAIKDQGVEDKDLKTTNFNIYPRYEWTDKTSSIYPNGQRELVGYEVSQTLEVKIRNLEKTADILQAGVDSGSNQVGNLQFTIENSDDLKAEAREIAIDEAKSKAKVLAKQLGVRLAGVASFSESGDGIIYFDTRMEATSGGSTPQIETGENKIESRVSITYKIK
ncbi:MAG: SIMPL domain-containing protein [Candidatus Nealsonbacteria bacterium]